MAPPFCRLCRRCRLLASSYITVQCLSVCLSHRSIATDGLLQGSGTGGREIYAASAQAEQRAALCNVWRRGIVVSGARRMNEVNARRARLVPGWVTVFGRVYHLGM